MSPEPVCRGGDMRQGPGIWMWTPPTTPRWRVPVRMVALELVTASDAVAEFRGPFSCCCCCLIESGRVGLNVA